MKVTMDVRERLIDLMSEAKRIDPEDAPFSEYLADFMISHGVTVREPDGCRYCKEYEDLPEHFVNGSPVGRVFDTCIQPDENGLWHVEVPSGADIGICFCPMCGRNLDGETAVGKHNGGSMTRYTDVDKLMKDFDGIDLTKCVKYGNKDAEQQHLSYSTMMMYEIASTIDDAPAADVVEVVRCKDCRFSDQRQCGDEIALTCEHKDTPWRSCELAVFVEKDDFCSYGEKMDKEEG